MGTACTQTLRDKVLRPIAIEDTSARRSSLLNIDAAAARCVGEGHDRSVYEEVTGSAAYTDSLMNRIASRNPRAVPSNDVVANSRRIASAGAESAVIEFDREDTPGEFQWFFQNYNLLPSSLPSSARRRVPPPASVALADGTSPSSHFARTNWPSTPPPPSSAAQFRLNLEAAAAQAPTFDVPLSANSVDAAGRYSSSRREESEDVYGVLGHTASASPPLYFFAQDDDDDEQPPSHQRGHSKLHDASPLLRQAGMDNTQTTPSFFPPATPPSLTADALERIFKNEASEHNRDSAHATQAEAELSHTERDAPTAVLDLNLPRRVRRSVNSSASGTDPISLRESATFSDADSLALHNKDGQPSSIVLPNPAVNKARYTMPDKGNRKFVANMTAFEYS